MVGICSLSSIHFTLNPHFPPLWIKEILTGFGNRTTYEWIFMNECYTFNSSTSSLRAESTEAAYTCVSYKIVWIN